MAAESDLRDRIVERAFNAFNRPDFGERIQANVLGRDGKIVGWRFLERIFREAAPAYTIGRDQALFKHTVRETNGIPHWCGIFAVWAFQAVRGEENIGTWPMGGPLNAVRGVQRFTGGSKPQRIPQKGDAGWMPTDNPGGHYVIVREVIPSLDGKSFKIMTIEGNWGTKVVWNSEIMAPNDPQEGNKFSFWYTIFATEDEATLRNKLQGRWEVKIGWKPWHYIFSRPNKVEYAEPTNPRQILGSGKWKLEGHKLRINWDNLESWDEWDLPLVESGQVGQWHSQKMGGQIGNIEAKKKK